MLRFRCTLAGLATLSMCVASSALSETPASHYFIKNRVSFGYYNDTLLWNDTINLPPPLFWEANTTVQQGFVVSYERNIFHTDKYLALNVGSSLSRWAIHPVSRYVIYGLSAFAEMQVWMMRTQTIDPYFIWSIAGPTLLSNDKFGPPPTANLSANFIFQDYIGLGANLGEKKNIDIRLAMYHYSNGDLFVHNDGFEVPVVLSIGYRFDT